jgi:hypothetical protein
VSIIDDLIASLKGNVPLHEVLVRAFWVRWCSMMGTVDWPPHCGLKSTKVLALLLSRYGRAIC